MSDFRIFFRQHLEDCKIPSNASSAETLKLWKSLYNVLLPNIPKQLFRYRSINEYSLADLKNGTISVCHANQFPDKYDSYVFIDSNRVQKELENGIKNIFKNIIYAHFHGMPIIKDDQMVVEIRQYKENGYTDEQITEILLGSVNYSKKIYEIKKQLKNKEPHFRNPHNSAKIACFTESVISKFMWDHYAKGYTGFALEYDFRTIKESNYNNHTIELFPVIYSDEKLDVTEEEEIIYFHDYINRNMLDISILELLNKLYPINQLYWFKSYLYKDKNEYEHEFEWRLLSYDLDDENDYAEIPDNNSLKAIYYGPDIATEDKEMLHDIALKKELKEYDVNLDNDSRKYS